MCAGLKDAKYKLDSDAVLLAIRRRPVCIKRGDISNEIRIVRELFPASCNAGLMSERLLDTKARQVDRYAESVSESQSSVLSVGIDLSVRVGLSVRPDRSRSRTADGSAALHYPISTPQKQKGLQIISSTNYYDE